MEDPITGSVHMQGCGCERWVCWHAKHRSSKTDAVTHPTVPVQVERMAKQLGVAGDVAYTCETAAHFWLLHVLARWEQFVAAAEASRSDDCIQVLAGGTAC